MSAPLYRHEALPSTQEEAHQLAAAGAVHGTAVMAGIQTAGRGTRGRSWTSPAGGLWLSVICRPESLATAAVLSIRAGLAVAETIEREIPAVDRIALKWPNDLFLHGRKLAGVLCEARWQGPALAWIVVGVGLNVRNEVPAELRATAIALAEVTHVAGPDRLAGPVRAAVAEAGTRGGELTDRERSHFTARNLLAGTVIAAPVRGEVIGIVAGGALQVRDAEGAVHEVIDAGVEGVSA